MVQNLILFREQSEDLYQTPSKIAKLFINRLVIDEEASVEHVAPFEFYASNHKMAESTNDEYEEERKLKGMSPNDPNNCVKSYHLYYILFDSCKEWFDYNVVDVALQSMSASNDDLICHFIYAGEYYIVDIWSGPGIKTQLQYEDTNEHIDFGPFNGLH